MSYFGTQGPAQDGGFIGGIARGNARLHNARVTRARYQKGIGAVRDYIPMANKFPDDSILYNRAKNFTNQYENATATAKTYVESGTFTEKEGEAYALDQYKKDRDLIAKWAESGPYVKESKALGLTLGPVAAVGAAYLAYQWWNNRPLPKAGNKSAFYGVFS
jgi:hypothetical protein